MPQPDTADLHVDALLTNISIGYRNTRYIADQIFPILTVEKRSDIVPKYDQSAWFRDAAALRVSGTRARGGGFTVDTSDHYFCQRYSYKGELYDEQKDNTDAPWQLEATTAEFVADKLQLRREVNFATAFFKTGVWANDDTGDTDFTRWSDYAASSPLVNITAYQDNVEGRIGVEANTLVIGKDVWNALRWHPDAIDSIKYTQRGVMTEELFAALAGIDKMLVGRALHTTAVEGTAEASVTYSRVWGKNALFLYVPPAPGLMTPAAGYTFIWRRVAGAIQYIRRIRDEEREADIMEGNTYFDQHLTAARAGTFLSGAVA